MLYLVNLVEITDAFFYVKVSLSLFPFHPSVVTIGEKQSRFLVGLDANGQISLEN